LHLTCGSFSPEEKTNIINPLHFVSGIYQSTWPMMEQDRYSSKGQNCMSEQIPYHCLHITPEILVLVHCNVKPRFHVSIIMNDSCIADLVHSVCNKSQRKLDKEQSRCLLCLWMLRHVWKEGSFQQLLLG